MARFIYAIALTSLLVCATAFAQNAKVGGEARQLAMGGSNYLVANGAVLNPYLTDDPAYLLLNPAYEMHYANYVWWNVGGGTLTGASTSNNGYGNQNVGVSFSLSNNLAVGAILGYDPTQIGMVSKLLSGGTLSGVYPSSFTFGSFISDRTAQTIPDVKNVVEVLAALRAGSLDLGFGFMYGHSNSDYTESSVTTGSTAYSSDGEASARMFGLRGGLVLDMGSGSSLSADAAVRFHSVTDNETVTSASHGEYSASGTEIQVDARLKYHVSNRFTFVPYAGFFNLSAEPKQDKPYTGGTATTLSKKLSSTGLAIGVGGEYKLSNFTLAGGLSYMLLTVKLDSNVTTTTWHSSATMTRTYTSLPTINLGAEWWLTDWLAARGGYCRMMGNAKLKEEGSYSTGTSTSSGSSESNDVTPVSTVLLGGINSSTWDGVVTLGLGLRFNAFALDATVSDEALRRGLGLVGGSDNINTFGYVTLSYNFE